MELTNKQQLGLQVAIQRFKNKEILFRIRF